MKTINSKIDEIIINISILGKIKFMIGKHRLFFIYEDYTLLPHYDYLQFGFYFEDHPELSSAKTWEECVEADKELDRLCELHYPPPLKSYWIQYDLIYDIRCRLISFMLNNSDEMLDDQIANLLNPIIDIHW